MPEFVLFDDAYHNQAFVLQKYCETQTVSPNQADQLDDFLQTGWQKNWHCAIFADYEWGLPLQKLPETAFSGSLKIVWFAEKHAISCAQTWLHENSPHQACAISTPQFDTDFAEYETQIAQIHAAISRGDCYQINHTLRLNLTAYGNPMDLYRRLRQKVPYAALARLPENRWILCFSPELFLKINENGILETEPMKGTAPILGDGLDDERAQILQNDPKNRAENTMIVDLLRNDLGKLAQTGGVSVPTPFRVSAFGKVWQMTSLVRAQLIENTTFSQIMQATFPCGSITGAPKRKSMEIISQLETSPRGLYTGSIGFLSPKNQQDGVKLAFSGCLNVAIRTLQLSPQNDDSWRGEYGVGSGIVIDSQAQSEYAECHWKSQFISHFRPNFDIFETMCVENRQIILLSAHLQRMAKSAHELNVPFDLAYAKNGVEKKLSILNQNVKFRFKLILDCSGSLKSEIAPMDDLSVPQFFTIFPETLPEKNPLRRHKISHRTEFDRAWQWAAQHGAFDALLFNENGFLLEGGRSSVVILYEKQWLTPCPTLDILPSVALAEYQKNQHISHAKITREMLLNAEKVLLGNALRGFFVADYLAI